MAGFARVEPLPDNRDIVPELDALAARASDWEEPFGLIDESFKKIEARRFEQDGPGWAPLAASTVARKAGYGDTGTLERTGELMASLAGDGAGHILDIVPSGTPSIVMGTDVPYAQFHQLGSTVYPDGSQLPARPVVQINAETVALWMEILQAYLSEGELAGASEVQASSAAHSYSGA